MSNESAQEHEQIPVPIAHRAQQARANLVSALRECGELADAVETFEGKDLLDVLIALDSIRFAMAESGQILQGVLRGYEG